MHKICPNEISKDYCSYLHCYDKIHLDRLSYNFCDYDPKDYQDNDKHIKETPEDM